MSSKQKETKRNYRNQPSTASALFTAGRNNTQSCTFCKGTHSTVQCNVVTSIKERKKLFAETRASLSVFKESRPEIAMVQSNVFVAVDTIMLLCVRKT